MKHFSTENLVAAVYGELSQEMTEKLNSAMEEQWPLKEKFEVLKEAVSSLQSGWLHPNEQSIARILKYAHAGKKVISK